MAELYKENIVDIDLAKGNIHRKFLSYAIGTGDNAADRFGIRVFRDREEVDLTGCSCYGFFRNPQGINIALTSHGTVDGNLAYVTLPQACYDYDGQFSLAIKLIGGGVTGTMRIVDGIVDNANTGSAVAPTGSVPTYQEILSTYDAMVAATAAANGAIAPLYANLTFPVKAGQYAIVDGALKRAIVDIATSEAYTAAHWTNAKIGSDLSELKSAISEETRNIWIWDKEYEVTGTKYVTTNANIPAGTYTMSAIISRTPTVQNCRMRFYKNSVATANILATPYISADGQRHSTTFTLNEKADIIQVLSGPSGTDTGTAIWRDIQIESGSAATAFVPHVTATDFDARNGVAENAELISKISEHGANLWDYGDLSGTKSVNKAFDFVEGKTYTVSAKIVSDATNSNYSRIMITDSGAHEILHGSFLHDGKRHSFTFTAEADCSRLYFLASNTATHSEGFTLSVTEIQVEEGEDPSIYYPNNVTAVDFEARKQIEGLKEGSNVLMLAENETYESGTYLFDLPMHDANFGIPVVFSDAMFTYIESTTDYPRLRLRVDNDRNLARYTTFYKIGSEDEYSQREWRSPAYIWSKRTTRVVIFVPSGCVLYVRKLGCRYENCVDRTVARGIVFHARPGTCNMVPELSKPAMQMAFRSGYDSFVVIPKISSDGQWFAYHDDKWIETGDDKTGFVNPDGSDIEEDEYNNNYFHTIPFTYLDQFRTGKYGNLFLTTKFMKLEDCFEFVAKTGMKLRFSMHPSLGISRDGQGNRYENDYKLVSLRRLVQKYGLLKDLTIIVNDIEALFAVFGNDIGGYCFPNATGSSWEPGALKPVNSGFVAAQAAKQTYGITVPVNCGLWTDSLFEDRQKAETLVSDILDAGFTAGEFTYTHTGIDGTSHSELWSEDIRWLMGIGVTEFTEGYNTSIGLNW